MSFSRLSLYALPPFLIAALVAFSLIESRDVKAQGRSFQLVEATIADVHRAIQQRQITCRQLVQAYVDRAKAYNGVSDRLVTRDGAPIPQPRGTVRARSPLKFPTETVAIGTLLPNFDQYAGPPIELGRMEPTASDRDVRRRQRIFSPRRHEAHEGFAFGFPIFAIFVPSWLTAP